MLSTISALLALGLLGERSSGEAGMAFIFFLPACVAGIALGGGAVLIRTLRANSLTAHERRLGSALGVLVVTGACALGVALALD